MINDNDNIKHYYCLYKNVTFNIVVSCFFFPIYLIRFSTFHLKRVITQSIEIQPISNIIFYHVLRSNFLSVGALRKNIQRSMVILMLTILNTFSLEFQRLCIEITQTLNSRRY